MAVASRVRATARDRSRWSAVAATPARARLPGQHRQSEPADPAVALERDSRSHRLRHSGAGQQHALHAQQRARRLQHPDRLERAARCAHGHSADAATGPDRPSMQGNNTPMVQSPTNPGPPCAQDLQRAVHPTAGVSGASPAPPVCGSSARSAPTMGRHGDAWRSAADHGLVEPAGRDARVVRPVERSRAVHDAGGRREHRR